MFKDHLVDWIAEYLHITHVKKVALEIIEDIDHRCVCLLVEVLYTTFTHK
jgi:hypothetical protein